MTVLHSCTISPQLLPCSREVCGTLMKMLMQISLIVKLGSVAHVLCEKQQVLLLTLYSCACRLQTSGYHGCLRTMPRTSPQTLMVCAYRVCPCMHVQGCQSTDVKPAFSA